MPRIPDKQGTEYDKSKIVRENEPLFDPPRTPTGKFDRGLLPITGIGQGQGMKPLYETAEEMNYAIDLYFRVIEEENRPPTMAGLSLALGFKSTSALRRYEMKGEDFATIIEVARTRVEEWKNELLLTKEKQCNGVIFDLKNNHGWMDRMEQTTVVQAGNTLTDLLLSIQGNVLRPTLPEDPSKEYAEYTEIPLEKAENDEIHTDFHTPEVEMTAQKASPYEDFSDLI